MAQSCGKRFGLPRDQSCSSPHHPPNQEISGAVCMQLRPQWRVTFDAGICTAICARRTLLRWCGRSQTCGSRFSRLRFGTSKLDYRLLRVSKHPLYLPCMHIAEPSPCISYQGTNDMHDTRGNGAALPYAFLVLTLYLFVSTGSAFSLQID